MKPQTFAALAAAGNLLFAAAAFAAPANPDDVPLGNPSLHMDGFRQAQIQANAVSARVTIINTYGDDLQAGRATPEEQGRCVKDRADLEDFVARTDRGAFSADDAWGDKVLAAKVQKVLANFDVNSCPTIEDFKRNGNTAFTRLSPQPVIPNAAPVASPAP